MRKIVIFWPSFGFYNKDVYFCFSIAFLSIFSVLTEDDKPAENKEVSPTEGAPDTIRNGDVKKIEKPEANKIFGAATSAVMVSKVPRNFSRYLQGFY